MKLSIMTLPLLPMPEIPGLERQQNVGPKPTLKEIYRQIKEAGAEALDISSIDFQFGGEAAVQEALQETGLSCSCYLAFIAAPQVTPDGQLNAVQQGIAAVDQTLRLGAKVMMFVPAGNQEVISLLSRQAVADAFAEVLRPVVAYAKEKGVTVVIEDAPHREFPMCSQAELRYLLDAVPGLMLVYDSGNMLHAGEDPVEFYEGLKSRIAHAHLKETGRNPDGALVDCDYGAGIVDFTALLSRMEKLDIYGAIELPPDFTTERTIKERVEIAIHFIHQKMGGNEA